MYGRAYGIRVNGPALLRSGISVMGYILSFTVEVDGEEECTAQPE